MTDKTIALVQARMGSTRFPGKMLADLGGFPLLEWVLRRVSGSAVLDQVVLATSDKAGDDALAELANRCGIDVFRGSESDVLGRFAGAAREVRADRVVRVCADNPFIDPVEIDRLVCYYRDHPCDYACNHQDRLGSRYADGFGAEMLSAELLYRIASQAKEPRYREHATLYLWDHPETFRLLAVPAPDALALPNLRFDVDRPVDLALLNKLIQECGFGMATSAAEIIRGAVSTCFGSQIEK